MSPQRSHLFLIGLSALAAIAFGLREFHCAAPFLDLRVFGGNIPLLSTYVRNFMAMTVGYAFLYGFSQWLQDGRGLNAATAGVILLPLSLVAIGVSSITGRRKEIRIKLLVAAVAQIVICLLLLVLYSASPLWLLVVTIALAGIPQGLASLANQTAVYYQADPTRMGASSGLLRTFTYLGALLAYEHGYHVVLVTDAMTDVDAHTHQHSVERIFPRLGETATAEEFIAMLKEHV